jgi:hypothetical protein
MARGGEELTVQVMVAITEATGDITDRQKKCCFSRCILEM